ncbi:MFS transporter, partial [bacterium]|nr:MFS transporter [bacterium]
AGRVLWGLIADKFGRRFSSITSLILLGASIVILPLSASWGIVFLVFSALVGFNFGAAMVLYATQTSDIYGAENFGRIYAFVGLSYGISGLTGPVVGGAIFDLTGGYWPAIIVATAVSVAGALFYYLMGKRVERHETAIKATETA